MSGSDFQLAGPIVEFHFIHFDLLKEEKKGKFLKREKGNFGKNSFLVCQEILSYLYILMKKP